MQRANLKQKFAFIKAVMSITTMMNILFILSITICISSDIIVFICNLYFISPSFTTPRGDGPPY